MSSERNSDSDQLKLSGQSDVEAMHAHTWAPWVTVPITKKDLAPMQPSALLASLKAGKIPWSSGYLFGQLGKKK
jgi:hypothetical protein